MMIVVNRADEEKEVLRHRLKNMKWMGKRKREPDTEMMKCSEKVDCMDVYTVQYSVDFIVVVAEEC